MKILFVLIELAAQQYWQAVTDYWHDHHPEIDWRVRPSENQFSVFNAQERVFLKKNVASSLIDEDNWKPDLVVVSGGGYAFEAEHLRVAKSSCIPTLGFIDTWYGYRHRFTFDGTVLMPDRLLTIDERMIDEATQEGLPADIMIPVGQPSWENISTLAPSKTKTVLFLDAPVARDYGQKLGYTEIDVWKTVLTAKQRHPMLFEPLLVAPHPSGKGWHDAAITKIINYDPKSLQAIDSVIGMFSAPMVHAFLAGRRVISLQPNATGIDMCPLSRHGYIQRASSATDLHNRMSDPLPNSKVLRKTVANSARNITNFLKKAELS